MPTKNFMLSDKNRKLALRKIYFYVVVQKDNYGNVRFVDKSGLPELLTDYNNYENFSMPSFREIYINVESVIIQKKICNEQDFILSLAKNKADCIIRVFRDTKEVVSYDGKNYTYSIFGASCFTFSKNKWSTRPNKSSIYLDSPVEISREYDEIPVKFIPTTSDFYVRMD
jgi:hypothetical protein